MLNRAASGKFLQHNTNDNCVYRAWQVHFIAFTQVGCIFFVTKRQRSCFKLQCPVKNHDVTSLGGCVFFPTILLLLMSSATLSKQPPKRSNRFYHSPAAVSNESTARSDKVYNITRLLCIDLICDSTTLAVDMMWWCEVTKPRTTLVQILLSAKPKKSKRNAARRITNLYTQTHWSAQHFYIVPRLICALQRALAHLIFVLHCLYV